MDANHPKGLEGASSPIPALPKPTEVEEPELDYPGSVPLVFRVLVQVTLHLCWKANGHRDVLCPHAVHSLRSAFSSVRLADVQFVFSKACLDLSLLPGTLVFFQLLSELTMSADSPHQFLARSGSEGVLPVP